MKKTTAIFLALLALTVVISGCVGKQTTTSGNSPATTPPASTGVSGEIPSADADSGITVETPESSSGETVDLGGSLI